MLVSVREHAWPNANDVWDHHIAVLVGLIRYPTFVLGTF
jgi:hypothetical protein